MPLAWARVPGYQVCCGLRVRAPIRADGIKALVVEARREGVTLIKFLCGCRICEGERIRGLSLVF